MEEMDLTTYRELYGKPRQRAAYQAREAGEQQALFQWIETVTPREPRLAFAFHIPSGELRDKGTAIKLQKMGVKRGLPDIWLPVPSRNFVGLVIELKTAQGRPSDDQHRWLAYLDSVGWARLICIGWVNAAAWLCWYLEREPADMGLEATI